MGVAAAAGRGHLIQTVPGFPHWTVLLTFRYRSSHQTRILVGLTWKVVQTSGAGNVHFPHNDEIIKSQSGEVKEHGPVNGVRQVTPGERNTTMRLGCGVATFGTAYSTERPKKVGQALLYDKLSRGRYGWIRRTTLLSRLRASV